MAYSLLAHLYPYIKGSQEDVATFSLQYLLSQSKSLNRAFTKRVADIMRVDLEESLQYICQVTGESEEKERPDMAGNNSFGEEVILFEMKFYASLTVNQPLTYLERLRKKNGVGLLFVCPGVRRTSLWTKLQELCNGNKIEKVNEYCVIVEGVRMAIITWAEILELLKQVAASVDVAFLADIQQLEGYCNQLDSDAFIPFTSEDLSAEIAKKEERYFMVVDEVMDLLMADTSITTSKEGTQARAYRKGYTRSLVIDEYAITLNYDRELWKNPASVETPFWLAVRLDDWNQTHEIKDCFSIIPEQKRELLWGLVFIAIEPLQNTTLSELCEDIKVQILKYIDMLRKRNLCDR